jgi:tetraacyldisaccharide 4'-kinase
MIVETPDFWYAQDTTPQRVLGAALSPLGAAYGFIARKRFDFHCPVPLAKPIVCIGNVTAGGAGKTPVALALGRMLIDAGYNPHFLSRGYGGREKGPLQVSDRDTSADVGDEPLLLAEAAPTWVSRRRALGAQAAIDTGANVIIMDDGLQNPALYKDFAVAVVDGGVGFGNKRIIPAGPLREEIPFSLSRVHAAVIIGTDRTDAAQVIRQHSDIPVFTAVLAPSKLNPDVAGKPVYAFAGIGRPEKFRDSLVAAGADVTGWGAFPDHYKYYEDELYEIINAAEQQGAMVVTTAKDIVRVPPHMRARMQVFRVDLAFDDAGGVLSLATRALAARGL